MSYLAISDIDTLPESQTSDVRSFEILFGDKSFTPEILFGDTLDTSKILFGDKFTSSEIPFGDKIIYYEILFGDRNMNSPHSDDRPPYMKRKIYDDLVQWKMASDGRTAVLIDGARRVGKSFVVEEFARNEYRSFLWIDFNDAPPTVIDVFENDSLDLDLFFNELSAIYGVTLYRRESLVIFDEVQLYPKARQMIKRLVKDRRFDYIETGSLISIKTNVSNIMIPSEEKHIYMHPMDFEEFLRAMGNTETVPLIKRCFEERKTVSEAVHRSTMNLLRQYMLVGGMPQAVSTYVNTKDFRLTDDVKRDILQLYRNDIGKFAEQYQTKVREVFETIPSQLSKKEKKFNITSINKKAKSRRYSDAFLWLTDGMIVNPCFNSVDPNVGLALSLDDSKVKYYMADTGLLITMAFGDGPYTDNPLYKAVLTGKLGINEGMITENLVAQMLVASGHRLYFYSRYGDDPDDNMEIDFLIRRGIKVCPVEVKSSRSRMHVSLDRFMRRFARQTGDGYVLHPKNVESDGRTVYLPLYMAIFL